MILLVGLFSVKAWGQKTEPIISGNYSRVQLIDFIKEIETQYNFSFFYKDSEIESRVINEVFEKEPLQSCLQKIGVDLILNFTLIDNQVFIYKGPEIRSDFFVEQQTEKAPETISQEKLDLAELRRQEFIIKNIGVPGQSRARLVTLTGTLKVFDDKSPVANGNVIVAGTTTGVATDKNGRFEILLEKGNHTLQFSSVGMKPTQRVINIYSNGRLDVELETQVMLIGDIDIYGDKKETVSDVRSGVERISEEMIKSIPALLGEPDIIRTTLLIPGVQTVGESAQGFNVRGGKTDQNLILVDGAPLYYPSHFFGNFSAVNSDMVKDAILYKGSMPAQYGGRISSVYEINTIEGDSKKIKGVGGISPLSAKIAVNGPLQKGSTFAVSARSTYSDYVLDLIKVPDLYNSEVGFNDFHAKTNLRLSDKSQLAIAAYTSNDKYKLHSDTLYKYKNAILSADLHQRYNDKWESDFLFTTSMFGYDISSSQSLSNAYNMTHDVLNAGFKNNNQVSFTQDATLNFGGELNAFFVNPGEKTVPDGSSLTPFESSTEKAMEYALFAGAEFPVTSRLTLETGLRLSGYLSFDDGLRYVYDPNLPMDEENIIDVIEGEENTIKKKYLYPIFRFSANYMLRYNTSVKFSYNRTVQYIHILTNSTAISPTDTWKLSDEHIPPQLGHQLSAGIFRSFGDNDIEVSVEGFFKRIDNLKEYKPGASLLLNDHIETEILNGKGKSYGVEFALKKNTGRLNGGLGYAYMRTLLKADSEFESEKVNNGEYFPANYDKPHNFNLLLNLKATRKVLLSSTVNYSTGRPITYPVAKYQLGDQVMLHYSDFNRYRIPDYFRMDFSVTFEGNLKADKKIDGSLTFAIYNVTARKNAYSVFFRSEGEQFNGYRLSVFATAIPTISYNFKF
ncbi:TonB-dependent receptor [Draconibacterium sp. IB214405]|uniref:TonB-dependent receptor n=1 Tax=Draconibacterium sp. IB214405 TaxID=3097352 RepID=UPI002A0DB237|nr:TonB-dependent receptor [Draconibacterium sp. IB214405]MDX8340831.1 TonB-dependent receptor [Draconibacterium sp. IB214405]